MTAGVLVILLCVLISVWLAWLCYWRVRITRPPIGVTNMWDILFMMAGILIIPYLYLLLPLWLVTTLLFLETASLIYLLFAPIVTIKIVLWLVAMAPALADVAVAYLFGVHSRVFYSINNMILVLIAVGVSNIWAQGGMKARHAAILAGYLAVYDLVFTALLPVTDNLFTRLAGLPFAPMFAWSVGGEGQWLALGLGDVLLASVFPLVMLKAFGRYAGMAAMFLSLGVICLVLVYPYADLARATFPIMVLLGPLMIGQYVFWIRRRGTERTTCQSVAGQHGLSAQLLHLDN